MLTIPLLYKFNFKTVSPYDKLMSSSTHLPSDNVLFVIKFNHGAKSEQTLYMGAELMSFT